MARAFSYIVKRDYGFAPNPFYGVLTLATCKPKIRKSANVGDFIIGNATAADGHKLIFMAKVSEIMTFDTYWTTDRFQQKKPVMNGSLKKLYGDNIYHHDKKGNWFQDNSHHTHADGSVNKDNLNRDTTSTDHVLICEEFFYLGKSMSQVPKEYAVCIHKGRGHHCPNYADAQKLWDYLKAQYPSGGKIDQPKLFEHFERYDGKS
ncbi:Nmad2 family putative nucleotide modification protein [Parabacteroides goldsteinii]|uniref:Nmad2 family putative nucleotide modification protein n=1 Tax=Parabacteroides goldsteinii TaxID=328812 RepID=UPI001898598C|nr:hypothetical protein [Parabacteroides goldsteinii]